MNSHVGVTGKSKMAAINRKYTCSNEYLRIDSNEIPRATPKFSGSSNKLELTILVDGVTVKSKMFCTNRQHNSGVRFQYFVLRFGSLKNHGFWFSSAKPNRSVGLVVSFVGFVFQLFAFH